MAESKRKNCPICGRFMRWEDGRWRCPLVSYDEYMGGWEHD